MTDRRLFLRVVMAVSVSCVACASGPGLSIGKPPGAAVFMTASPASAHVREWVVVTAKARGEIDGGWRCTKRLWQVDDQAWKSEGTETGDACGEVGETRHWPRGYNFLDAGVHTVRVEVYDDTGSIVGRAAIDVNVYGGE